MARREHAHCEACAADYLAAKARVVATLQGIALGLLSIAFIGLVIVVLG